MPDAKGRQVWIAAISKKSGYSEELVASVLEKHGIRPKVTAAVPQRLMVTSLSFTGKKLGATPPSDIDFGPKPMGPGLWAVTSQRNFRGKTSILNIIRWCLTGRQYIADVMTSWFTAVTLRFTLDDREFEVRLSNASEGTGELLKHARGNEFQLASFSNHVEFEAAMSDFFMEELGLQKIENHIEKDGKGIDQPHGWVWLFTAMWVEPRPSALFGVQMPGAMSARMMQMYLGFPWVNTTNEIKAAQSRFRVKAAQSHLVSSGIRATTEGRIASLAAQRADLQAKFADVSPNTARLKLAEASQRFVNADADLRAFVAKKQVAEDDFESAKMAYAEARRSSQAAKESAAAGYVFRAIRPVCCPSCDEVITEEAAESHLRDHTCVVCKTPDRKGDDEEDTERTLLLAENEAKEQLDAQTTRVRLITSQINEARLARAKASEQCATAEAEIADMTTVEENTVRIQILDAQIAELRNLNQAETEAEDGDSKVLAAAEVITKEMYEVEQGRVLKRVSDLTKEYAVTFGIENLQSVSIDGGVRMKLIKNGQPTFFSKCTDGEKARLKVAATLAMLKVSEDEGVGRHPGLLLIDSPGDNAMVSVDYENLVSGISTLSEELKTVQIILSAVSGPVILSHVPKARRIEAVGDDYLW